MAGQMLCMVFKYFLLTCQINVFNDCKYLQLSVKLTGESSTVPESAERVVPQLKDNEDEGHQ